jgi:hypothetical protein
LNELPLIMLTTAHTLTDAHWNSLGFIWKVMVNTFVGPTVGQIHRDGYLSHYTLACACFCTFSVNERRF